ncbi:MAG: C-terminal processing protease CtpA/Prc [Verrucomicrobiales bacterium]|jgi:C-terminal processing protease CtpA/Prc
MLVTARTLVLLVILTANSFVFAQNPPPPVAPAPTKKLAPTQPELAALAKNLNSDDFKTRETAQIILSKLATDHPGITIDPILENYIDSSTLPEARYRLRAILYNSRRAIFEANPPGFVGIVMNPIGQFVMVSSVVPGSAAEKFGLIVRDMIVSVDGNSFSLDSEPSLEFSAYVMGKKPGDKVVLKILRNNVEKELSITLGKRPDDLMDSRFHARFDAEFKTWLDENIARLKAKD